MGIKPLCQ